MIPSLSLYRLLQITLGITTGSPLLFLGLQAYNQGDLLIATAFFILGVTGLILPGFLMQSLLSRFLNAKAWAITTLRKKVKEKLPKVPFQK